ncbi:MAG: hypothetical protein V1904_01775 [Bacteroidota bacterium]
MKKIFFFFMMFPYIGTTAFCQNNENINTGNQINPSVNIQYTNLPDQQLVMNDVQQAALPQQTQTGNGFLNIFSSNNSNDINTSVNTGTSNHSKKTYTTYSSSPKRHFMKIDLNLRKVHILRKFRHECPMFKAKTYHKIFSSKKRNITHCFNF